MTLSAETLTLATPDGQASLHLFRPTAPTTRAAILFMDAFGPRPALFGMAERLAGMGLMVALPDLFYRFGAYGPFDAKTAFAEETSRSALMRMMGGTTQDMSVADTLALLSMLSDQGVTGPVAAIGYCMGGARALNAAAAFPDRITAVASFHGGGLASDAPDSPHRRAAKIKAKAYVGVAGVDRSFPPEQSALLAQSLREAEVDHVIENYVGMGHGWTVPDSAAYDEIGAARHWRRLATLLEETVLA